MAPSNFFAALPAIDRLPVETLTRTLHLLNAGACLPQRRRNLRQFRSVGVRRPDRSPMPRCRDMRGVLSTSGIDPQRVVCEVTEQRSASQEALHQFVARAEGQRLSHRRRRLRLAGFRHRPHQGAASRHRQVRCALDHAADGVRARLRSAVGHGRHLRQAGHH